MGAGLSFTSPGEPGVENRWQGPELRLEFAFCLRVTLLFPAETRRTLGSVFVWRFLCFGKKQAFLFIVCGGVPENNNTHVPSLHGVQIENYV